MLRLTVVEGGHALVAYRRRRASRSDSSRQRMSSSRTVDAMSVTIFVGAFAQRREGRENRTGTLDVTDDGTGSVVHELNADLGNTTARACVARNPSAICPLTCRVCNPPWPCLSCPMCAFPCARSSSFRCTLSMRRAMKDCRGCSR